MCVEERGAGHLQDGPFNGVIFEIIKSKNTSMTDELLRVFKKGCQQPRKDGRETIESNQTLIKATDKLDSCSSPSRRRRGACTV